MSALESLLLDALSKKKPVAMRRVPRAIRNSVRDRYQSMVDERDSKLLKEFAGRGLYTGHGAYRHRPFYGRGRIRASGRGKFNLWNELKHAGKAISSGVSWAGKAMGPKIREALENKAVAGIQGAGAYSGIDGVGVHSNNLVEGSSGMVPELSSWGDETGAITLVHREYVTDIYGPTTAFNVQSYALNPALASTFPFASQLCCNYDEYCFEQLVYEYRSVVTDIGSSTSGQCGTVILATNYNAAGAPFTDKQQMMEYAHAHSCKTTESMVHGVECDPKKTALSPILYTRSSPVPVGQDAKTYDHGLFQIAIANSPTGFQNQQIGELWCYYKVTVRKPKLFVTRGLEIDRDVFMTPTSAALGATATGDGFGTSVSTTMYSGQQNNIGCLISTSGSGIAITFPAAFAGAVMVRFYVATINVVAGVAMQVPTFSGSTGNITRLLDCPANTPANQINVDNLNSIAVGSNGTRYLELHLFVTGATGGVNNSFQILPAGANTALVRWWLSIEQFNNQGITKSTDRMMFLSPTTGAVVSQTSI